MSEPMRYTRLSGCKRYRMRAQQNAAILETVQACKRRRVAIPRIEERNIAAWLLGSAAMRNGARLPLILAVLQQTDQNSRTREGGVIRTLFRARQYAMARSGI